MIECLCGIPVHEKVERLNPITLRTLHLCDPHATLHDQGHTFNVREWHLEENR